MKQCIALLLFATSCAVVPDESISDGSELILNDQNFKGRAIFSKLSTAYGYKIRLINEAGEVSDQMIFKHNIYHLDSGDVNQDGKTDVLLGLVKATQFDPVEKKRLFILRIDDGQLRPLWLGSKVCQELIHFKTLPTGNIQTLEKTQKGNYAIGWYQWQGFGLTLIQYIHNEISLDDATKLFYQ